MERAPPVKKGHTVQELARLASLYSVFRGEKVTPFVVGEMSTADPLWVRFCDWIEGSAIGTD